MTRSFHRFAAALAAVLITTISIDAIVAVPVQQPVMAAAAVPTLA